jgi:hypothetical protein
MNGVDPLIMEETNKYMTQYIRTNGNIMNRKRIVENK